MAAELRRLGVRPGDRVVAYLPDIAEAVVAFLATAAVGAVWSSCGQDYAPDGAAARLGQLEPRCCSAATATGSTARWIDKRIDTTDLANRYPGTRS